MNNRFRDYLVAYFAVVSAIFIFTIFSKTVNLIAIEQVASVSKIGATITETPTNKLASNLRDYSKELTAKEKTLNEREIALRNEEERVKNATRNIIVGSISLSLISLFAINAYLYRRNKKQLEVNTFNPKYTSHLDYLAKGNYRINIPKIT